MAQIRREHARHARVDEDEERERKKHTRALFAAGDAHPPPLFSPTFSPFLSLSPSLSGKDASEDFDEIGHSNAAKEQLTQFYLGEFEGGSALAAAARKKATGAVKAGGGPAGPVSPLVRGLQVLLPLLAVLAAVLLPKILSS